MATGVRTAVAVGGSDLAFAAAGTPKSLLAVIAPANDSLKLTELGISFGGAGASTDKSILFELCLSDVTTAGTSTSVTPVRTSGIGNVRFSAAKSYSVEPTVLTPVREWLLDPFKGLYVFQNPLGREIEPSAVARPLVLRATIQTGNTSSAICRVYMECED